MSRQQRKALGLEVAALESRCVPTVISPFAFGGQRLALQHQQASVGHSLPVSTPIRPAASTAGGTGTTADVNGGTNVGNPSPSLYLNPATLTPSGLRLYAFSARTFGPYAVTAPTVVGPVRQVTYIGSLISNQFAKGTMIAQLQIPAAAHAIPNYPVLAASGQAAPNDGFIALRDRSVAATGTSLVLDLTVTQQDGLGRPTGFSWIVDNNSSGGTYSGAAGQGTGTIIYAGASHSKNAAGSAGIVFQGLVQAKGVNNITAYDLQHFN